MKPFLPASIGPQEKERLLRAASHLRDHVTDALNLDELARMAGFSKYHFHRLFKEEFGEPPGDYVKRLRLEQAAGKLLGGNCKSITDLAYSCGFASSQHFSGLFKKHFGVPPVTVRDKFNWRDLLMNKIAVMESDYGRKHCLPADVRKGSVSIRFPQCPDRDGASAAPDELALVDLPPYRVAFIRLVSRLLSEEIYRTTQKMVQWMFAERLFFRGGGQLTNSVEIVPDADGRYIFDVCVTIPEEMSIDDPEMQVRYLPGGQYGIYRGKYATFEEFNVIREKLMRGWWMSSYYPRDQRPRYVIIYGDPALTPDGSFLADFCFPVKTLQR